MPLPGSILQLNEIGSDMKKRLCAAAVLFAGSLPVVAQAQVFDVQERPLFHEFVTRQHGASSQVPEEVRVGVVLPEAGVIFHEVPPEYHVRPGHRFAVVNDRVVVVDTLTRRIEEIVE
jgi:hypothetical protein